MISSLSLIFVGYQNKKEAKSIFKEEATQRSRRPSPVQPTLTKLAVEEKKEARSQEDPSGLKHLSNLSNYVSSASEDSVFSDVTEIPYVLLLLPNSSPQASSEGYRQLWLARRKPVLL